MSNGVAVDRQSPVSNDGTDDEGAAFNIYSLGQHLSNCMKGDDVLLDEYIDAYRDIKRMINLFGGLFAFVNSDVRAKLLILEYHRQSTDGAQYESVASMVAFEKTALPGFEKQRHAAQIHGRDNACRTLLRLHRAMKFLESMFRGLAEAELSAISLKRSTSAETTLQAVKSTDSAHAIVSDAYETHLATHHTWIVRNVVRVALRAVPSRSGMLKYIVNSQRDVATPNGSQTAIANGHSDANEEATKRKLLEQLVFACDKMKVIHATIQKYYETNGMLSLV